MDDELIVVDDDHTTQSSVSNGMHLNEIPNERPKTVASVSLRTSTRRRSTPPVNATISDRTMRSAAQKPKLKPKLKLKLNEKAGAMASGTSFLGQYDRELDSDEEDLAFEEQFILRMPPGEDCDKLRKQVVDREIGNDVWFKFKDSRRAVFHIGKNLYSAKLVDLPCIIESQKTLDNKQMFKVADICQMLVVEDKIDSEDAAQQQRSLIIDDYIWPHGITPPLHHVRKRRFRKRVNRSTIETVEQEVERLLEADARASQVQYEVLENVNPDLSDSEFIEREDTAEPGVLGSDAGDAPTPLPGIAQEDEEDAEEDDMEGEIDEDLAAELDLALGDENGEGDEEDEDQSDEDEDDEDEEDDDDETVQVKRLLNDEISDLEQAIAKKNHEIASSANPLIKRRFEDALKKLQSDLDMKLAQREELKEQQRLRNAGMDSKREESEPNDDDLDEVEDDDLFGDLEMENAMDTG